MKTYTLNALVTLDEGAWQMHKCIINTFIWKSKDSKQEVKRLKGKCYYCLAGSVLPLPQMLR